MRIPDLLFPEYRLYKWVFDFKNMMIHWEKENTLKVSKLRRTNLLGFNKSQENTPKIWQYKHNRTWISFYERGSDSLTKTNQEIEILYQKYLNEQEN